MAFEKICKPVIRRRKAILMLNIDKTKLMVFESNTIGKKNPVEGIILR